MSELRKLQEVTASLRQHLDAALLQIRTAEARELDQLRRFEKDREERAMLILQNRELWEALDSAYKHPPQTEDGWIKIRETWEKYAVKRKDETT